MRNGVTQHLWKSSPVWRPRMKENILIVLTYFITTIAQSATWARLDFWLLCQFGFEDWNIKWGGILTTTAIITPKLLFHIPLLMHCPWLLKSQESKVSLWRNKGNYTDYVDAWSSFSFQEPIACCIGSKNGRCPLYSIIFGFIYFVDETVEGNYQTQGSFSGFVWWRQQSRERIQKNSLSVIPEDLWSQLVVQRRIWVLPSDVCTAAWVLLCQKQGCVVRCCDTPRSASERVCQQIIEL